MTIRFEPDGFGGDQRALDAAFINEVRLLLTHRTRVRREAQFVNEAVELESSVDGINWLRVYRYSQFRAPGALLCGNHKRGMFYSPPLLNIAT